MKTLKDRPFALLGVNGWKHEPGELGAVMQKESLTWRSFDAGNEAARAWGGLPTPSYFVIDREGIIRRSWIGNPGARAIDAALEKLLGE